MKRNIKVNEKELVSRLNAAVEGKKPYVAPEVHIDTATGSDMTTITRWDNHGPVQFEEQADGSEKKQYEKPMAFVDDVPMPKSCVDNESWKEDYFSGKTVEDMSVSFSPRDENGSIVKGVEEWDDNADDRTTSRATAGKSIDSRKAVEDLNYKRFKKDQCRIAALKKALDEYNYHGEDTQSRTHYEEVNHPQHYNNYDVEVIDMMEKIFGREETAIFCKLNAFKYRMRAGTKPGQSAEKDLNKEQWYLNKKKELQP